MGFTEVGPRAYDSAVTQETVCARHTNASVTIGCGEIFPIDSFCEDLD